MSARIWGGNVAEGRRPRGSTLIDRRSLMAPRGLVGIGVVDVEVVELAGRAVALEGARVRLDPGALEQPAELGDVVIGHLLLDAVRPQAFDLALDVDLRLVDRIPEALPGIAADHETAGLAHEGR